jgi:hypothetical protein
MPRSGPNSWLIRHACLWCLTSTLLLFAACGVAEPATSRTAPTPPPTTAAVGRSPTADTTSASPTIIDQPAGDTTARPPAASTSSPIPSTISAGQLALSATSTTGQIPGATPMDVKAATVAAQLPSATPIPPPAVAWQAYHSQSAGYRVEYPAGWVASEQANADGSIATTFAPTAAGASITVLVMPGSSIPADDLPNTRCQQVTIGGLAGIRCFDTLARSTSVALSGQNKTFTISPEGKHLDSQIFERFLSSFAPVP